MAHVQSNSPSKQSSRTQASVAAAGLVPIPQLTRASAFLDFRPVLAAGQQWLEVFAGTLDAGAAPAASK